MSDDDESDDDLLLSDEELAELEWPLLQAIRDAHQLDVEIDDELRRLTSGEYNEPGPSEDPS